MSLKSLMPPDWAKHLDTALQAPSFAALEQFLEEEWANHQVFPPKEKVFTALALTPFDQVKVVILGQDPYHDDGQAHGLAFSVAHGVKQPPSLKNIFKELNHDLGSAIPDHGCLEDWARQGVLLLNTVLTVRAHQAGSHQNRGWEAFTDSIIGALNQKEQPIVFVLWGKAAQQKLPLVDSAKHLVISSAHPSPFSARNGFFGSNPFSRINHHLQNHGITPIDWALSDTQPRLL